MSVLIKGLEMPETEYMDVRIFRDGTAAIATGTKPYYRELKAESVRHGKWIWVSSTYDRTPMEREYECSECHHKTILHGDGLPWEKYCPNCGARMDEE